MPNTTTIAAAPGWCRGQRDPNPDFCDGEVVRRVLAGRRVDRPLHQAEKLAIAEQVRASHPGEKCADKLAVLTGTNRGKAEELITMLDEETDRERERRHRRLAL